MEFLILFLFLALHENIELSNSLSHLLYSFLEFEGVLILFGGICILSIIPQLMGMMGMMGLKGRMGTEGDDFQILEFLSVDGHSHERPLLVPALDAGGAGIDMQ